MTKSEQKAKAILENAGWRVLVGGWPDFLAIKDGQIKFVEVKRAYPKFYDKLRPAQIKCLRALFRAGLKVEVMRVSCGK